MSLINQTLKNLDKRQATGAKARPVRVRRQQGPSKALWLGLIAAFGIFLVYGLPQYQTKPKPLVPSENRGHPDVYELRPAIQPETSTIASKASELTTATDSAATESLSAESASTDPAATASEEAVVTIEPKRSSSDTPVLDSVTAVATSAQPMAVANPNALTTNNETNPAREPRLETVELMADEVDAMNPESDSVELGMAAPEPEFSRAESAIITPAPSLKIERSREASRANTALMQQAVAAQQVGNLVQAQQLWQQIQQQQPQDQQAVEQLALLAVQLKDWNSLNAQLQRAKQYGWQSRTLQLAQLQAAAQQQQWPRVLEFSQPLLAAQPDATLFALQAHAQTQLQKSAEALLTYQQWQRLLPNDAKAWLGAAVLHDQLGQAEQARASYRQAIRVGQFTEETQGFIRQRLAQLGSQ